MNDLDGLALLKQAKNDLPDAEVILITGHGTIQSAVVGHAAGGVQLPAQAARHPAIAGRRGKGRGQRPLAPHECRVEPPARRTVRLRGGHRFQHQDERRHLAAEADRPTNASVLIQGETGTGKELVAQAIHQNSPRKNKPFVALNCAALSENILESELFGHVRGAFTDASNDRIGKFEYAHGGTLFLDEVGDMPMATQIKLLRVLQNGEITRVGSNEPIKVNVRILSATNRNLEQQIANGSFRSDLYHRLKVVTVVLPRLIERSQDIPLLIDHFIRQFSKRHEKVIKSMSTAARRRIMAYDWPGNVRQLQNVVESMVVVDYDGVLDVDDLPTELTEQTEAAGDTVGGNLASLVGKPLEEVERLFISETLRLTGGNREEAAEMLGIGERTLYRKIKEYNLVNDETSKFETRICEFGEFEFSLTAYPSAAAERRQ